MNKRLYIAYLLVAAPLLGLAQSGNVDSTTIISVDPYEPILTDAFKIKENPSIKDTNKIIPELKYSFLNKQVPVAYELETIKPAKIKGEPLVKLYRGYAKVGFGTNSTPLAELYFNAKRSRDFGWGFAGKHFSSSGINKIDYSGYSDNSLSLFGKRYLKEFTLYAKAGYDRYVNHYYGIPSDNLVEIGNADEIRQDIDKFSANFSLTRNFTDTSQFDYNFDVAYRMMSDIYDASENHVELNGKLSKYHKKELYQIGLELNQNKLDNLLNQGSTMFVGINPEISTNAKNWQFKVGMGLYLNSFSDTKFHFYPKAEFKYNVVEHIVIPYVGINGGLQANNLNSFYLDNPFINTTTLAIQNSNQKYNLYGGIRGSLSSKITFNTSFSRQQVEGMPLYVKELGTGFDNRFTVFYDTVSVNKLTAELAYQKLEKWKVLFGANYFSYNAKNAIEAWHKPSIKVSLSGIYDLSDKIVVRTDLFYFGKQYAQSFETIVSSNVVTTTEFAEELKGVFDANIGLEYRYTKKLSAFINFNNIASQSYERWQDYPTQKFQVLGGLTYSF
ncbi:MAG: TonB-dependent receptor [Flavobacteriales bacterium]|nr:TonB-dependent receptor [Flavobacteriales bacterium]